MAVQPMAAGAHGLTPHTGRIPEFGILRLKGAKQMRADEIRKKAEDARYPQESPSWLEVEKTAQLDDIAEWLKVISSLMLRKAGFAK